METPHSRLSRDIVVQGYRFLLGREPESEEIIQQQIASHADFASFRTALLGSAEFCQAMAARTPPIYFDTVYQGYWSPSSRVDYRVPAEIERRLVERTRNQWTKLGQEEPYWSVLTSNEFRSDRIDAAALASFRESGRQSAALIDLMMSRAEATANHGICVELGCGVGRITRHLAERFDSVTAVDISPGNLALCQQYMNDEAVTNVDTLLVQEIDDLAKLPNSDFLYSIIVLQHNTPPVQYRMLDLLLARINPEGFCLIQTVADTPGYSFDAEEYLNTTEPVMEVHSFPMSGVLFLMHKHGLVVKSVRMDPWVDNYGSYTFLSQKLPMCDL